MHEPLRLAVVIAAPTEAIDGVIGPNTTAAIRAYQKSAGMTADGYPSLQLLQSLERR